MKTDRVGAAESADSVECANMKKLPPPQILNCPKTINFPSNQPTAGI